MFNIIRNEIYYYIMLHADVVAPMIIFRPEIFISNKFLVQIENLNGGKLGILLITIATTTSICHSVWKLYMH